MPPRIVNLSEQPPHWQWLKHAFSRELPDWHHVSSLGIEPRLPFLGARESRWRAARQASRLIESSPAGSILVSHGPRPAAIWSTFASRARPLSHEVVSFNFTEMPEGLARRFFTHGLRHVSRFVVSSQWEREYYADYFAIPIERIEFKHWGVQPPAPSDAPPLVAGRYVCALGSQARDYATLVEAARLLPATRFLIVGGAGSVDPSNLPANVEFRSRIPFQDATNIMRHSVLMVLPLNSSTARCGHVTAVAALHLGVPIVATHCRGLTDYLADGDTAALVRQGDPRDMADAISALVDDPAALQRLASNGMRFAARFCSEDSVIAGFRQSLIDRQLIVVEQ